MSGHVPVMLGEVLASLAVQAGDLVVDATFGGGGYTRAILAAQPNCKIIGLDRDPQAVARGKQLEGEQQGRFTMVESQFSQLDACVTSKAQAIVLDIGVSSFQIDQAERGFSFMQDGPLDMRMSGSGPSAADVVASLSEAELAHLFFVYGEEREARRVARAMVNDRQVTPYTRTSQLAGLCARVIGRKHDGQIHPATRVFQALRIYVNDELGELEMALAASERALGEGGRLVVVTFHSLEDRVVKTFFNGRSKDLGGSRHAPVGQAAMPTFELMNRKPILAGPDEIAANPRARSAKLRAAIRTKAPARIGHVTGLAGVTPLDRLMRAA